MSCKICGNPLNSDERFCSICGAENEDAVTPVETGEITPNPPLEEDEGGFYIDDSEFVWNIYEFPKPKKTEDIEFVWERERAEAAARAAAYEARQAAEQKLSAEDKSAPEEPGEPAPVYVNIYRSKEAPKKGEAHTYHSSELVFELMDDSTKKKEYRDDYGDDFGSRVSKSEEQMLSQLDDVAEPAEMPEPEVNQGEVPKAEAPASSTKQISVEEQRQIDDLYYYDDDEEELGEDYESLEAFLFGHDAFRSIAAKPVRKSTSAKQAAPVPPAAPEVVAPTVPEPIAPTVSPVEAEPLPVAKPAPAPEVEPETVSELETVPEPEQEPELTWPADVTFIPEPSAEMKWRTFREIELPDEGDEEPEAPVTAAPVVEAVNNEPVAVPAAPIPSPAPTAESAPAPAAPQMPKAASPVVLAEQEKVAEEGAKEPVEPINPVKIEDVEKDIDPNLDNYVFTKDLTKTKPYARRMFQGKQAASHKAEREPLVSTAPEPPIAALPTEAVGAQDVAETKATPVPNVLEEKISLTPPEAETPETGSLEEELFREIAADSKGRDEEVEKFFTFSKKNEEFQRLLDKEYEKIKQLNADKTVITELGSPKIETAASPLLNTFDGEPKRLEGFLTEMEAPPQPEAEEPEVHFEKANHLSEMAKARESFFSKFVAAEEDLADSEPEETTEEETSVNRKIKFLSKGASEVHVTVEVKGTEVADLTEESGNAPGAETEAVAPVIEEEEDFLTSLLNEQAKGKKSRGAASYAVSPVIAGGSPGKTEPTKVAAAEPEVVKTKDANVTPAAAKVVPPLSTAEQELLAQLPVAEAASVPAAPTKPAAPPAPAEAVVTQETTSTVSAAGATEPPAATSAPPEKEANKADNEAYFDQSLDEIWKAQEQEREEEEARKASRRTSPLAKFILVVIAIILVIEIIALGIKFFMPGTKAEEFVTNAQIQIVQTLGNGGEVIKAFFSKEEEEPEIDENVELETDEPEIIIDNTPQANKTQLMQEQYLSNYNNNIQSLVGDDSLAYEEGRDYGYADINASEPITNNVLRVTEDGSPVYIDANVAAAIVAFNSRWIAYTNEADPAVYEKVMAGGGAEKLVNNFAKAGQVTKTFHKLALGDIRHGEQGYYAWTYELIETLSGSQNSSAENHLIYWIVEDDEGVMRVMDQIAY